MTAPDALPAKPDRIADLVYFLRSRDLEIPEFHALQLEIADALATQAQRIAELERENDEGIARLAAKLGTGKNYTANYEFDKTDTHTRLFCAASDWMDRAEHAEAALRQALGPQPDKNENTKLSSPVARAKCLWPEDCKYPACVCRRDAAPAAPGEKP